MQINRRNFKWRKFTLVNQIKSNRIKSFDNDGKLEKLEKLENAYITDKSVIHIVYVICWINHNPKVPT